MTNQEAITIIGNLEDKDILFNPCDVQDAKTMAIKALEQEPCDKYINEIDHLRKYISKLETQIVEQEPICIAKIEFDEDKLREIVKEQVARIEITTEQEPSGDCISRQAVLEKQYRIDDSATLSTRDVVDVEDIEDLPPVNPQETKTGYWKPYLKEGLRYQCSACDSRFDTPWEYCPHCGARMVEPQETETWNGIHAQITAPKGTFDKIFNDTEEDIDDI